MKQQYQNALQLIDDASSVLVVQAENPDGDSLATSSALEQLLTNKQVTMFCLIDIPNYLHYIAGHDRVVGELPKEVDLIIIVDTASQDLLKKTLELPEGAIFKKTPVLVLDHHLGEVDFNFAANELIDANAASSSCIVYNLAKLGDWPINLEAAEAIVQSIMADTQGLTNESTTVEALEIIVDLVKNHNVNLSQLEDRRLSVGVKTPDILRYKGELLSRVEYHLDGQLSLIAIPWEEIEEYSPHYNPSVLVINEMCYVEGVSLAIAFKQYPNGKITGKVRCNASAGIAQELALAFGGGGHKFASGFKVQGVPFSELKLQVIEKTAQLLEGLGKE